MCVIIQPAEDCKYIFMQFLSSDKTMGDGFWPGKIFPGELGGSGMLGAPEADYEEIPHHIFSQQRWEETCM